jgi:hypothetical protein
MGGLKMMSTTRRMIGRHNAAFRKPMANASIESVGADLLL